MCNPAALQLTGTFLSVGMAAQNASAVGRYQRQTYEANAKLATDDSFRSYAALQARQSQEHAKAAQAIDQAALETKRRLAVVRTSTGGVAGNSVDAVVQDFHRSELDYQTTVIRNQAMLDAQVTSELEAVRSQTQGRIMSGMPGPTQPPDLIGMGLAGFGKYLEIKQKEQNQQPQDI